MGKIIDFPKTHNYNLIINDLAFEWDILKNRINIKRHRISFESAVSAFFDEFGILIKDTLHSETEDRFVLIGYSEECGLSVICHCFRENEIIRIISARKATKREAYVYRGNYEKGI